MFSIKEDGQFPVSFVIKQVEVNEKVVFQKKKKILSQFNSNVRYSINPYSFDIHGTVVSEFRPKL